MSKRIVSRVLCWPCGIVFCPPGGLPLSGRFPRYHRIRASGRVLTHEQAASINKSAVCCKTFESITEQEYYIVVQWCHDLDIVQALTDEQATHYVNVLGQTLRWPQTGRDLRRLSFHVD